MIYCANAWSEELLNDIGIPKQMLGSIVPSGEKIGVVTAKAAKQTGLPQGLPVCAGGHDHLCAALALGVTEPGDLFNSIGTSEAIVATLDKPNPGPTFSENGIAQGVHVVPNRYYAISGMYFSGGSFDWLTQLLCATAGEGPASADDLTQIIQQAQSVYPGCDGAYFLPHLMQANPPTFDPKSRGAFVGLTRDASRGHLARAVLEGLAFEYQRLSDCVCESFEIKTPRLIATGGGTRNALLMEIKASLAKRPIAVPDVEEATCLGAAMLAGLGTGVYKDVADAHSSIRFDSQSIENNQDLQRVYENNYQTVYLPLYQALRDINHRISDLVNGQMR